MICIVVACTEDYYKKAAPLWNSWKDLPYRKQILCIGFEAELEGVETATCRLEDLKSYRTDFPSNRKFFVCAEGGEFLNFFNYDDEDIIVHIDADMIIQRDFNELELETIENLKYGDVVGSAYSIPYTSLREEFWKLKPKRGYVHSKNVYQVSWSAPMICAGLVACTAKTYKDIIATHYLGGINTMVDNFDHHAAGQWIMNYIIYKYGNMIILPFNFHNADWFIDTNTTVKDKKLYCNNQLVMFNHTKFNHIYE